MKQKNHKKMPQVIRINEKNIEIIGENSYCILTFDNKKDMMQVSDKNLTKIQDFWLQEYDEGLKKDEEKMIIKKIVE